MLTFSLYFAKAAESADFTDKLASFLSRLLELPTFSSSCASLGVKGWADASGGGCCLETVRLNGSWKVSYRRFT